VLISRKRCKIEVHLQLKTNRASYMAYQNGSNGSDLDLEGHSPVADVFKCNPSNIFAAFYTFSTDSVLARFLCISRAYCTISGRKLSWPIFTTPEHALVENYKCQINILTLQVISTSVHYCIQV